MIFKSRKGSILDLGILIVFLSVIIGGLIFGRMFSDKLFYDDKIQDLLNESGKQQQIVNSYEKTQNTINYGVVTIFVGLLIVMIILSYNLVVEEYFLPIAFLGTVFFTFVSGLVAKAFTDIFSRPEFSTTIAKMGLSFILINKLPFIVFFAGVVVTIILYIGGNEGGI